MGWKSKVTAVIFLTMGAAAVSSAASAQSTCRTTCDNRHVDCMNAGKSDGNVCLPQWLQCKNTCETAVTPKPATTPIAMTGKPAVKH